MYRRPLYRLYPLTLRTMCVAVYHIVSLQRKDSLSLRRKSNCTVLYVIGTPPTRKDHSCTPSLLHGEGAYYCTLPGDTSCSSKPQCDIITYCVTAYVGIRALYGNVQLPRVASRYRIPYKLCVTFVVMCLVTCNVSQQCVHGVYAHTRTV